MFNQIIIKQAHGFYMVSMFKNAWSGMIDPLIRRPNRVQSAALCFRTGKRGKEVLLITSRERGRWILPKGWPINGLDGAGTAAQEAWEEAGVKPLKVNKKSLGQFHYDKILGNGASAPVEANVYSIEVDKLSDSYPEADERKRDWMAPNKAAELVEEPELKAILRAF
jgi:8-oxo-dGTP pyrophosphatase MutT (NUDIX family)